MVESRWPLQAAAAPRFAVGLAQEQSVRIPAALVLATTTLGARLDKMMARSDLAGEPGATQPERLHSLLLRHGGTGTTTVIQNAAEAAEQLRPAALAEAGVDGASPSAAFASVFRSAGLETIVAPHSDGASVLYTKLLLNCVINPLTALHSVQNGALMQPHFQDDIAHLTHEFVEVLNAIHVRLSPSEEHSCSAAVQTAAAEALRCVTSVSNSAFDRAELHAAFLHVYRTCEKTAHNLSSMYTDLHPPVGAAAVEPRRRRVQSELEQLTGHLLQRAQDDGVPPERVQHHRRMFELVRARERELNGESTS